MSFRRCSISVISAQQRKKRWPWQRRMVRQDRSTPYSGRVSRDCQNKKPQWTRRISLVNLRALCGREILLPNAEGTEDEVQNVVGGSRTRNCIQRPQRLVKIEQQHLVRDLFPYRDLRRLQRGERILDQSLMSYVGQKPGLRMRASVSANVPQDLSPQLADALPGN